MLTRKLIVNSSSLIVNSLLSIFLLLAIIFYLLPTAHAQTATVSAIPQTVSPTSPLYTDLILHNMFHSFSCLAIGSSIIGQPCLTYQVQKDAAGAVKTVPVLSQVNLSGGAVGTLTSTLTLLYVNPPVRTASYLASIRDNFGVVKPAHAQVGGSGSLVLDPIIKLWQMSRNVAYLIMTLIFVIIGIMIMFKNKINPQTVITVQAALPGLIIGLILITFSYFLAGLITDLAFIGTNIVGYFFSSAQDPKNPVTNLVQDLSNENVLTIMSRLTNGVFNTREGIESGIGNLFGDYGFKGYAYTLVSLGIFATAFQIMAPISGSLAGFASSLTGPAGIAAAPMFSAFGSVAGGLVAGAGTLAFGSLIFSLVITVIMMVAILYTMVKLLMKLVNEYLSIVFLTITAPFHFLAASLPGRQELATNWIRNMLCHVLSFPAVVAVLYFANMMLGPIDPPPFMVGLTPIFTPPSGTVYTSLPLLGGFSFDFIRVLMAFAAILSTPAIPEIICRTIGKASQAGQLIGQEVGAGAKGGQQYLGQGSSGFGAFGKGASQASSMRHEQYGDVEIDPSTGNLVRVKKASPWRAWRNRATPADFKPVKLNDLGEPIP